MIAAIEKFTRIFGTTVPAFFAREKPISRNAKPACIKITSTAATTTQIELIADAVRQIAAACGVQRVRVRRPRQRYAGERGSKQRRAGPSAHQSSSVGNHQLDMVVTGGRGVFVPMSKIPGRAFSIRSTVEPARLIFGHRDKDPPRGPH